MDIKSIYSIFKQCDQKICTDTRTIVNGSLFVALHGDNFNGNKYVKQALSNGCKFAISDDPELINIDNVLVVEDTLQALQELANYHRNQFNIPVIGITGSNGKTTTKELLASVLSERFNVHWTKGNFNNHLGVPFTLLELNSSHELAIIEMGANQIGDIKELCEIAEPNLGLITNIGNAHLEGFGDLNGVIKAKTEMYTFLENANGRIFINSNEDLLNNEVEKLKTPILYGKESSINFEIIPNSEMLELEINKTLIKSNLFGVYNANNILTAYVIGKHFEISDVEIKKAIESYFPKNNRSQLKKSVKENVLILDSYNANPSSMNLAIDEFLKIDGEKVFVLGEMKELGSFSREEHIKILDKLNNINGMVNYVGMEFKYFEKRYNGNFFANVEKLINSGVLNNLSNSNVLIKGSRSVNLDLIEDLL